MLALPNPRHERFARALADGKTADDAYVAAGYKPHPGNGARLKADPAVQARVQELLAERAAIDAEALRLATKELAIDKQWVLEKLVKNARIALGEEKITITIRRKDKDPVEVEVTDRDAAAANRALELIGKHFAMFTEKVDLNGAIQFIERDRLDREV